jgi:hypothetical protein
MITPHGHILNHSLGVIRVSLDTWEFGLQTSGWPSAPHRRTCLVSGSVTVAEEPHASDPQNTQRQRARDPQNTQRTQKVPVQICPTA